MVESGKTKEDKVAKETYYDIEEADLALADLEVKPGIDNQKSMVDCLTLKNCPVEACRNSESLIPQGFV